MFISRIVLTHIKELIQYFPVISLTGPRQAGKTTLLKEIFSKYRYISLEDPDQQLRALDDPRSFLNQYDQQVIFDETQRVPSLFSYLQTSVDADRKPGRYILSGSQNFLLRKNISQSLAGRVGIARLFPLDLQELTAANLNPSNFEEAIFNGFYPAQFSTKIPARLFYPNYVATYVERDVSSLINASNLVTFQRFLQTCAIYAGQLLNYSTIAGAVGISVPTIQSWLSVLEQSNLIFRLPPYHRNFNKRIVKSPKLYFYDTGLLCYLLNMKSIRDLSNYYNLGALFENLIIAECMKSAFHQGEEPKFYFFRDSNGLEVDLLLESSSKISLIEIKATRTYQKKLTANLHKIGQLTDLPVNKRLIYGGEDSFKSEDVEIISWQNASSALN